jgi:hypothetical protein
MVGRVAQVQECVGLNEIGRTFAYCHVVRFPHWNGMCGVVFSSRLDSLRLSKSLCSSWKFSWSSSCEPNTATKKVSKGQYATRLAG